MAAILIVATNPDLAAVKQIGIRARPHFADQALVNGAARASRPYDIDPFAQEQIMLPAGGKRKTGPLCSSQLHIGPAS